MNTTNIARLLFNTLINLIKIDDVKTIEKRKDEFKQINYIPRYNTLKNIQNKKIQQIIKEIINYNSFSVEIVDILENDDLLAFERYHLYGNLSLIYHNHRVIREIAKYGSIHILNYVKNLTPELLSDAISNHSHQMLSWATNGNYYEILKILFENGATSNKKIILYSQLTNSVNKLLIQYNIDIEYYDPLDKEYLFINNVKTGNIKLAKYFITNGIDACINDNSAIYNACENGDLQMINLLCNNRATLSINNFMPIQKAVSAGHLHVLKYCENFINLGSIIEKLFKLAVVNGHVRIVKHISEHYNINLGLDNNCAIQRASGLGYIDIVKYLLKFDNIDPSACGSLALTKAMKGKYYGVIQLLLSDGRVDIDRFNELYERYCINDKKMTALYDIYL